MIRFSIDLAKVAVQFAVTEVWEFVEAIYRPNGTFEDSRFWKHGICRLLC